MNAVQQFAELALARPAVGPRVERRSRYFQGMSILMLAIVLTGFSRTFFLRAFFAVPPIAPHIYVHALVMTAWFTVLAVAGLSLATALGLPAHFKADPVPNGVPMSPEDMIQIAWRNFGNVAVFSTFVSTAIWLRHRPEALLAGQALVIGLQ